MVIERDPGAAGGRRRVTTCGSWCSPATGGAFSAGADVGGEEAQERYDAGSVDGANLVVRAILELDKPVVCGLNGVAAGVGMSIALAVRPRRGDRVGSADPGLHQDRADARRRSHRHRRCLGRPRAGDAPRPPLRPDLGAREAFDAGLVSHVFADDEYAEGLDKIVRRLASGAPLAFAATKKAVNAATLGGLDDAFQRERAGQSLLLRTDDVARACRPSARSAARTSTAAERPYSWSSNDRTHRWSSSERSEVDRPDPERAIRTRPNAVRRESA